MRIAIIAKTGPAAGRRIVLRGGQVARIGRTEWADFAFPEDPAMAEIHFAIHCGVHSAMIQALAVDRETRVNGIAMEKGILHQGDLVDAGSSQFIILVEDAAITADASPLEGPSNTAVSETSNKHETREIAEYIGLSEAAIELARTSLDPTRFGDVLVQSSMLQDALRWYAHTMPKPKAVLWACRCVEANMQSAVDPVQRAAYRAALQWANDPNETNRSNAALLAEASRYEGVGGMLAAAVGWSGGSLGPSNQPDIPPDDRLTGRSVCSTLIVADSLENPIDSPKRLLGFIERIRNASTLPPPA